jgi:uncharacterized protein (TIGR03067 family)
MDPRKWSAESDTLKSQWNSEMFANWTIKDSVLSNKVRSVDLSTNNEFGDVELLLEFKLSPKADAGIYLRGTPQIQIWDHTDKDKFKIGAGKGSGGLYNNSPGAAGKEPSVLADKPLGEWNSMRIVLIGNRTSVWLNGQQVVDRCVMENFWEKTQPLFSKGVIQLQSFDGAEVQWRNIFVREIPKSESTAAFLSESPNTKVVDDDPDTSSKIEASGNRDAIPLETSLKGILKNIDSRTRSLTVVLNTSKGEKSQSFEVALEAGDISALEVGDEIEFFHDPKLNRLLKFKSIKFPTEMEGLELLQGEWLASVIDRYGNPAYSPSQLKAEDCRYVFMGTEWKWSMNRNGQPFKTRGAVRIDSKRGTIDLIEITAKGDMITFVGIYKCNPTTLSVCLRRKWFADQSSDSQRPRTMKSDSAKPVSEHFQFQKVSSR